VIFRQRYRLSAVVCEHSSVYAVVWNTPPFGEQN
jgi:hypothetical protein